MADRDRRPLIGCLGHGSLLLWARPRGSAHRSIQPAAPLGTAPPSARSLRERIGNIYVGSRPEPLPGGPSPSETSPCRPRRFCPTEFPVKSRKFPVLREFACCTCSGPVVACFSGPESIGINGLSLISFGLARVRARPRAAGRKHTSVIPAK